MERHGSEGDPADREPTLRLRGAPLRREDRPQDDHGEEDHDERSVQHAGGRDDPPHRTQHRLGELEEDRIELCEERAAPHREPREHRASGQDDHVGGEQPVDEFAHDQGWNRPRACNLSFSSWDTSTLVGVRRNTWSATRCMEPATAYAKPLEKSISRRCNSRGRPWRFRMTGWLALRRSPTSCASLKPCGSTTWTRAALVGPMVRTTLGRGADMPDGSSRATA